MDNLISRQAAIDALRTCYDTETISMDNGDEYINYGDAVGEIEQLPSAQPDLSEYSDKLWRAAYERGKKEAQADIVRCKDCKYHDENWRRVSPMWLPCMDMRMGSNWYCGYAERREDV